MVVCEVMGSIADTVSDIVNLKGELTIDPVSCVLLKVSTLDINWHLWSRAFSLKPDHYQTCCQV